MPPKARPRRRRDSDGTFQPSTESEEDSEESSSPASSPGRGSSRQATATRTKSSSRSPGRKDKRSRQPTRKGTHRAARRPATKPTAAEGSSIAAKIARTTPKIVIRNPTKRFVTIRRKKEAQEPQDPSLLLPPKPRKKKKSGKAEKSAASDGNSNGDNGEDESQDELAALSRLPLPSSSRRHVFNKSISMIGAMNIQAFGTKKSSNPVLMRIITDILRRYDIVLCQEVRSPAGSEDIVRKLAETVSTPSTPYGYITSRPIGRGRYQERYVFLYRTKEWRVLNNYVIDDDEGLGDKFMREPYVARFQHMRKPNVRITLVGCHTQPEHAFDEVRALVEDVYGLVKNDIQRATREEQSFRVRNRSTEHHDDDDVPLWRRILCCCFPSVAHRTRDVKEKVETRRSSEDQTRLLNDKTEPIVMMGDFNAAGSYVNKGQRAELDTLLHEHGLYWGIQNTTDTTVADGENTAYDRFVFEKEHEKRWIGNTSVWRFDQEWERMEKDTEMVKRLAKRVTDHYPIEFELRL